MAADLLGNGCTRRQVLAAIATAPLASFRAPDFVKSLMAPASEQNVMHMVATLDTSCGFAQVTRISVTADGVEKIYEMQPVTVMPGDKITLSCGYDLDDYEPSPELKDKIQAMVLDIERAMFPKIDLLPAADSPESVRRNFSHRYWERSV